MERKQEFYIPKLKFELDGAVIFFGNKEEIERYKKEQSRVFNEWRNLLLEILDGKTNCISIDQTNTVCTLSHGIENKDTVRYSNFFKKTNGELDAILHHEFSKDDLDVLIYTYLFGISKDESIQVGDIIKDEYDIDDREVENKSDLSRTSKAKKMLHNLKGRTSDFSEEKVKENRLER